MLKSAIKQRRQHGYALTIMLVLLIAGGLYVITSQLNQASIQAAQDQETANALRQAKEALLAYAVTFRDTKSDYGFGYLPCPDMAYDDATSPNMIGSQAGSCSRQTWTIGLLPYRTLGIPELRDGSGNCLWYVVSGEHIADPYNKTALTPYPPVTPGQYPVGEFSIQDAVGNVLAPKKNGPAAVAAIVIAPRAALANQNRSNNSSLNTSCSTSSDQAAAYIESLGPIFIHGIQKNANGEIVTNDQLGWLTAQNIFDQAQKRSDYNGNAPTTP